MGGFPVECFRCKARLVIPTDGGVPFKTMERDKKGNIVLDGKRVICKNCEDVFKQFNNPSLRKCLMAQEAPKSDTKEESKNAAVHDGRPVVESVPV